MTTANASDLCFLTGHLDPEMVVIHALLRQCGVRYLVALADTPTGLAPVNPQSAWVTAAACEQYVSLSMYRDIDVRHGGRYAAAVTHAVECDGPFVRSDVVRVVRTNEGTSLEQQVISVLAQHGRLPESLAADTLRGEYARLGYPAIARFDSSREEQDRWVEFLRPWTRVLECGERERGWVAPDGGAPSEWVFEGTNIPPGDSLPSVRDEDPNSRW